MASASSGNESAKAGSPESSERDLCVSANLSGLESGCVLGDGRDRARKKRIGASRSSPGRPEGRITNSLGHRRARPGGPARPAARRWWRLEAGGAHRRPERGTESLPGEGARRPELFVIGVLPSDGRTELSLRRRAAPLKGGTGGGSGTERPGDAPGRGRGGGCIDGRRSGAGAGRAARPCGVVTRARGGREGSGRGDRVTAARTSERPGAERRGVEWGRGWGRGPHLMSEIWCPFGAMVPGWCHGGHHNGGGGPNGYVVL